MYWPVGLMSERVRGTVLLFSFTSFLLLLILLLLLTQVQWLVKAPSRRGENPINNFWNSIHAPNFGTPVYMFQLLEPHLSPNFWDSMEAFQLLELYPCPQFWNYSHAPIFGTTVMPQFLELYLCPNFWHSIPCPKLLRTSCMSLLWTTIKSSTFETFHDFI